MSNIIQFPEDRCVKASLERTRVELKEMYDAQNLCYETLSSLEERISEAEHLYNEQFGAYVKARGLENIEVAFLEYVSDNIKVNMETGEVEYIIPPEEEKDE
tara:strand:- start:508 stop:813 length:306 start_codon:yes stop_codon:yes gene_type:complete